MVLFPGRGFRDLHAPPVLLQQTAPSLLRHHPAPQPHFDGMRAQVPRPGAGLRPYRQQRQLHHGQAGGTAPDHTARIPHAQGHGKHARGLLLPDHGSCQLSCDCCASAAGTATGCDRAGRTARKKDRLRACAFMGDSCLFSARCAPAMQALLAAQPFLRHNQHELGVSLPENRDPVNLWRNNGELFRERARLHR